MMRFAVFALAMAAVSSALPYSGESPEKDMRLIQFNETYTKWMSEAEVLHMLRTDPECAGFFDITSHQHWHKTRAKLSPIPKTVQESKIVKETVLALNKDRLLKTVAELSSFKPNRYYQTKQARAAAEWLRGEYIAASEPRNDIDVTLFEHSWEQPSVIARIPGSGPHAHETVVIGGHIDSINTQDPENGVAPGADDDASGSSTVLEIFRTFVESGIKNDRAIEFHAYAAEEVGLLGSQDVVEARVKQNANVVSMLQLDMTLYQARNKKAVSLVTDFVSKDLTELLKKLVDLYCSVPYAETTCGYACSDHASWTKAGFHAAFPFETPFVEHNPDIHTPEDLVKNLDVDHGLEYAKLAVAYVLEMAGISEQ